MDEYPTDELPEPPAGRDHYAQRDQQDELWWALNRLTARQRSVVVMRYYLDLSEAETAAELGVSKGTVKSTLHHAMSRLRTELGRSGETEVAGRELAEVRSVPAARVPVERELALAG
jgi:DNA-directed RNA polymerase specialized sigma24 family protein